MAGHLSSSSNNAELVELGDVDELVRLVERLCGLRDWEGVVDVRRRCRLALERGRQLWPVAAYAEYRLALEAPGPCAARMLEAGGGRFALGPLAEVAASTHTWDELGQHAPPGPVAALAGHERVLRGEDLEHDDRLDAAGLDLPRRLQSWEPPYPLARYWANEADFSDVAAPAMTDVGLPAAGVEVRDPAATEALIDLVSAWVEGSNGRAEATCAAGDVTAVLATRCITRARLAEVPAAHALAFMAWCAASGGAHGRRRGMAVGRFGAWWAVSALAGALDNWPLPADRMGEIAGRLRWYRWAPEGPESGWVLRLAVEDPSRNRAWVIDATDRA